MATKRVKQFYFTRHDDELWEAIQALPEGDRNHEIRKALRHWFLSKDNVQAEQAPARPMPPVKPVEIVEEKPKAAAVISEEYFG